MKLKHLLCAALSVTMLAGGALATDLPMGHGPAAMPEYQITRRNDDSSIMVWGAAKELGEGYVHLKNSNESDPYSEIIVKVNDNTAILDAVTGAEKTFADLKEGETLYAWVSPAMTRSIPPQTNATLVVCNLPADFGAPQYAQVEKVTTGEDGTVDVLMSNAVVLHLNKDTELLGYKTKDVKALTDIKPGTMLLSWYRMVALSMPGQATPTKVMIFPYAYDGYVSAAPGALSVGGKALELTANEAPYVHQGKLMVPVRKLAEALECTVTWSAAAPDTIVVEQDGKALYTLTLGAAALVRGDGTAISLATPAMANNRVTFACIDDLLTAHNVKAEAPSNFGW